MTTRRRLLLADDDTDLLAVVEMLLEADGWDVTTVTSGNAALDALTADSDFAAAVLDYRMPGLDGVEVARARRAAGDQRPMFLYTAMLVAIDADVSDLMEPLDKGSVSELRSRLAHLRDEGETA